jgi:hypothetical protein
MLQRGETTGPSSPRLAPQAYDEHPGPPDSMFCTCPAMALGTSGHEGSTVTSVP